jgi:hypothetical protein
MSVKPYLLAAGLFVVAGCAGNVTVPSPGLDHPANPQAAAASPPPDTMIPVAGKSPQAMDGMQGINHSSIPSMQGMDHGSMGNMAGIMTAPWKVWTTIPWKT